VSDNLALEMACAQYLRRPSGWTDDGAGHFTPTFEPPLTTAEQATFADLQKMARFGIASSLTLAEYQAMKADLATGRAFLGIASPTQAQAVAAERAIIRVLGALLRDG
jgi:hypothetical protein